MKAAEGNSIAICISFSACTRVSSPLELLRRGEGSGMGRFSAMSATVQHTAPVDEQVYLPLGQVQHPERKTCSNRSSSAIFLNCAKRNW